jgi:hypothetical protein
MFGKPKTILFDGGSIFVLGLLNDGCTEDGNGMATPPGPDPDPDPVRVWLPGIGGGRITVQHCATL